MAYTHIILFALFFCISLIFCNKNIWRFFSWRPFSLIQERVKCNLEGCFSGSSPPKSGHARNRWPERTRLHLHWWNTNGETTGSPAPAWFPREAGWRLDFSIIHKSLQQNFLFCPWIRLTIVRGTHHVINFNNLSRKTVSRLKERLASQKGFRSQKDKFKHCFANYLGRTLALSWSFKILILKIRLAYFFCRVYLNSFS